MVDENIKQRLRAGMVSHHEQQASKCNGEQQHRELWPAYNPNIASPQASSEGLFQQSQAFSQACAVYSPLSGGFERYGDFSPTTARGFTHSAVFASADGFRSVSKR